MTMSVLAIVYAISLSPHGCIPLWPMDLWMWSLPYSLTQSSLIKWVFPSTIPFPWSPRPEIAKDWSCQWRLMDRRHSVILPSSHSLLLETPLHLKTGKYFPSFPICYWCICFLYLISLARFLIPDGPQPSLLHFCIFWQDLYLCFKCSVPASFWVLTCTWVLTGVPCSSMQLSCTLCSISHHFWAWKR